MTTTTTNLDAIVKRVLDGERLTFDEGCTLITSDEPDFVANLADTVRKKRIGDDVTYATTFYIHPTNLCELSCPMCSFYAKPGWEKAWFSKPEDVEKEILEAYPKGLTEIHVVGGLWRDCDLNYYEDLFGRIRRIDPNLHIKALTPVEYDFLAKLHGIPVDEVFSRMMAWGLGSLPGGGAEVLVEKIRKQVAPQKITSDEFLAIHKVAHRLGLPSNVTMLYGHVEEPHHLVTHMTRVRDLQDETGGFKCFVPLKFHLEGNPLGKRAGRLRPPVATKLLYATSRLMLDNFTSIKALWNYLGVDDALIALQSGADDLSSTNEKEKIIVMAGGIGRTVNMTRATMDELITSIGRNPKLIHSGAHNDQ